MGSSTTTLAAMHPIERQLRAHALTYPDVTEDFPWDHCALKIKGKVFVFLGNGRDRISMTAKLPMSHGGALMLPFAEPTGYGLGKSGWVTARFAREEEVPVGILKDWIDESYRAVAPKKLIASLDVAATSARAGAKTSTVKKATVKKATVEKATVKKATVKKATVKKATVKKATVKKATVKKATMKKTTAKKATVKKAGATGSRVPRNS
jgi:predicted DNA-binding protein (MmcQ/YjbR family)